MECLPLGLIGYEDTPMLLLVSIAVDAYRSVRENENRTVRRHIRRTVRVSLPGAGNYSLRPAGRTPRRETRLSSVTPMMAMVIGVASGMICFGVTSLLERLKVDDVVGAIPVHLAAGAWGTLAIPLLSDPSTWGTGLGRADQFLVQLTGVGACFAWAFCLCFSLLWLINRVMPLRVDAETERVGLNIAEHGASTAILDLLGDMERQRLTNDFTHPISVEPYTEVG